MRISATLYGRMLTLALTGVSIVICIELARRGRLVGADEPPRAASSPARIPSRASLADQLSTPVGDIDFAKTPLNVAIKMLSQRSGANIAGDWDALGKESPQLANSNVSIDPTQPVTFRLHNPTLGQALNAIRGSLPSTDESSAGFACDPGGILLLGADYQGWELSVTTLPQFFNVDDLIGPPIKYVPPVIKPNSGYDPWSPRQSRSNLIELAHALQPFVRHGTLGCFGRRLFVVGYMDSYESVAKALAAMRHPIHVPDSADTPLSQTQLPTIPTFEFPEGASGAEILKKWEKAGAGAAVVELSPQEWATVAASSPRIGTFHDTTVEEIAEFLINVCQWPFIVVPRGEEDNRVHIRGLHPEAAPRAYDVSALLSHPDLWRNAAEEYISAHDPISEGFVHLVRHWVDPAQFVRDISGKPFPASCWNGILLIQEAPEIHRRIPRFLAHLRRTGKLLDVSPGE